ncbi:MAG: outer membrane beta-barrel protein [Flavobacteriia bacterium]|nr:outer membrane beta-barrel protein [Flavobacteriia bacterium]
MNELDQDNELRKFFQNRFEEESISPPRGLFLEIFKQITVQSSWWKLPLFWISSSSIILVGSLIYLITTNNATQSKNKANPTQNELTIKVEEKNEIIEKKDSTINYSQNSENLISQNKEKDSIVSNKTSQIYSIQTKSNIIKPSKQINDRTKNKSKDKFNSTSINDFSKNEDKNTKEKELSKNENFISNTHSKLENQEDQSLNTSTKDIGIISSLETNEKDKNEIPKDSVSSEKQAIHENKESIDTTIQENKQINNTENLKLEKAKKIYKWTISLSPSVGIQSRIIQPTAKAVLQNDLVKKRRHPIKNLVYSLEVSYQLSPRWSINGGINRLQASGKSKEFEKYITKKSNEDYEISSPEGEIRIDNQELGNSFSSIDSNLFKIQFIYKSTQFSFPFTLKYSFSDKKIQPYVRFGLSMDLESKRSSLIKITNEENQNVREFKNKSPLLGKSFQGIVTLGFQTNFQSRFNLFFEQNNSLGLTSFIRRPNYNIRINNYQLRFGLRFSF